MVVWPPTRIRTPGVPSPAVTSSEKRQRHKDGHRSRIEAARAAEQQAQRRRRTVNLLVVAAVVAAVVAGVLIWTNRDDGDDVATDGSTTTAVDDTLVDDTAVDDTTTTVTEATTPCPATDGTQERVTAFDAPIVMCITEGEPLEAEVVTTDGTFVIALDTTAAPTMANNFASLARYKYFDGTRFHRLIPGFVVQGGSSGVPDEGSGGPGYSLPDVEKPTDGYQAGDVAMARSTEVSGSQFFVVVGEGGDQLTNEYPRFGTVTSGMDAVDQIVTAGSEDGTPTRDVLIESVTIRTPEA